jgi:glutamyl-tRNA reductase
MHTPIVALKTAAKDPESTTVIDVIRKLFNLQEKAKGNSAGEGGEN